MAGEVGHARVTNFPIQKGRQYPVILKYILRRLWELIPLLFLISLGTFFMIHMVPGDPAVIMAGMQAPESIIQQIREEMGLNLPIHEQIFRWYRSLLLHGDLGDSYFFNASVTTAIFQRLPLTLTLTLLATLLASVVGIVLGIIAAKWQNTVADQFAMVFSLVGVSIPSFWLGLLLMMYFSVHLRWFPTGGYVPLTTDFVAGLKTLALPTISLSLLQAALITRISRASMIEVLREDYIRTAAAKGVRNRSILYRHALKNALVPIITVIGTGFGALIGGAVIIEIVFSLPGIGRLVTMSVLSRDYPLLQGTMLVIGTIYILVNLLVDVLYVYLDPRIHYN
jgi:peptide/nickel transport system permease protein